MIDSDILQLLYRQLQELESKFKDAYSQSLSNKDERIQVLEKRVEETTLDNNQLREELASLKKQTERLRELSQANGDSPHGSPSLKRMNSPREWSRLREQASEAIKMRDKLHRVHEDVSSIACLPLSFSCMHTLCKYTYTLIHMQNTHLSNDLLEAKNILQSQETTNHRLNDRIQMLEQLNSTLEEEKRTLLGQVNKLLEQNQNILVRTLESKDQAIEEERIFK